MPFFSIITCTYNSATFIEDNLKSVKNQKYKNFEHIFIDGFSNDGTY
jgi:glycosyltransferase involved in cell wall biosynthesis